MSNHCEKRMTPIDIFSDLHMHSRYSDGTGTIEQMARDVIKKHNEKNRYLDETSPWIINAAINRGIPIVMGSDSHTPKTLGQYFHRTQGLVQ